MGKTTFIKAILGKADYTGEIEYDGKAAYFSQEIDLGKEKTVEQTLLENATSYHHGPLEDEFKDIEKQLADPLIYQNNALVTKLTERFIELQSKISSPKSPRKASKIKEVLQTLEIEPSWLSQKVGQLSTGQRAIIALAQILCSDAAFLLLDEPTNHLDFKRLYIF